MTTETKAKELAKTEIIQNNITSDMEIQDLVELIAGYFSIEVIDELNIESLDEEESTYIDLALLIMKINYPENF